MKKILIIICLCVFAVGIRAQEKELILEAGVRENKAIDAIYAQFSEAYRTLDVEKVANLYTENAAYLPPDADILQGRPQIRASFQEFFDWVKGENRAMTISFRIFQRNVAENMAYDVGIYTIRQSKDGKEVGQSKGKFVVVAVKDKSGKWLFQVDGYSNLKPEKKQ